jgi:hypothetical protein
MLPVVLHCRQATVIEPILFVREGRRRFSAILVPAGGAIVCHTRTDPAYGLLRETATNTRGEPILALYVADRGSRRRGIPGRLISVVTIGSFMTDNRWLGDNDWSDPPVTISGSTFDRIREWLASQPDAS